MKIDMVDCSVLLKRIENLHKRTAQGLVLCYVLFVCEN